MKGRDFIRGGLLAAATMAMVGVSMPASAAQRPLSDFTSRQWTFCAVFTEQGLDCAASGYFDQETCFSKGNAGNITTLEFWSDPKTGITAGVDSLGLENEFFLEGELDTSVMGSVSESPRPDGLADVQVTAHANNALTRGFELDADFNSVPLFGYFLGEVQEGAPPTLGDSLLQISFTNTAPGAPLPDFFQLVSCPAPGQAVQVLSIRARASGPLRAAFGVPEGTPGRLEVTQTGLIGTSGIVNPHSRVAVDAFPAEHVIIRATGH